MGHIRSVAAYRAVGACVFFIQVFFSNIVYAQSIATSTAYWDTLSITANGTDVTNSLVWSYQNVNIDHSALSDDQSGQPSIPPIDIPNPGWSSFSDDQNTIVSSSSVMGDRNILSVTNTTAYNGRSDSSVKREGVFIAPEAGNYTFSIDFSLAAEVNNTHTEIGGGSSNIFASPYVIMLYSREVEPNKAGNFTFQDNEDVNLFTDVSDTFGTDSNSGTLSMNQTFAGSSIQFAAGESIYFYVQVENLTSSYSTEATPVAHLPIPAALPLMATGLLGLFGFAKRKSN